MSDPKDTTSETSLEGSDSKDPAPRFLGEYELIEELSRGGMGVVFKARQIRLKRLVAVKMVLSRQYASPEAIRRFRVEAEAAASLQHPHIVRIHDVGEWRGQPYYSMDYIEGPNLAALVREGPLPAKRAAAYVRAIAAAMHYAHERGVLHRDLKPSNVLIDCHDEPRITDFGLAKRIAPDTPEPQPENEFTHSGQILGSPSYLPPEQAGGVSSQGKRENIGVRSDVYGLGAILYHLLTGRPPFHAETPTETLHQVLTSDPLCPRLLNPSVPLDLQTITLRCLEKQPKARFSSARDLAEELSRFIEDKPIRSRPVGQLEKTWRWCRRNPRVATFGAATAILLLAVGIGSPAAAYRISKARDAEQRERLRAEFNTYAAEINLASHALEAGNLFHARQLVMNQRPKPGQHDLRSFDWRLLWELCRSNELATLMAHKTIVMSLAFSPDGMTLASADWDGMIRFWDAATRLERASPLSFGAWIRHLQYSTDGRRIAVCGGGDRIRIWDVATREQTALFSVAGEVARLALSPDGQWLAAAPHLQPPVLWNLATGQVAEPITDPNSGRPCVAFSSDSRLLAYSCGERQAKVIEVRSRALQAALEGHRERVVYLAFSPDGQILATASADGSVKLWSVSQWQETGTLLGHKALVTSVAFSSDGSRMATSCADATIKLWDTASRQELKTLLGHANWVNQVVFSPDGRTLASASDDHTVKLWPVEDESPDYAVGSSVLPTSALATSADRKRILTVQPGDAAVLWDETVSNRRAVLASSDRRFTTAAFSADGRNVAWLHTNGSASVQETVSGRLQASFRVPAGRSQLGIFSQDNRTLFVLTRATSGFDPADGCFLDPIPGPARFTWWDADDGSQRGEFETGDLVLAVNLPNRGIHVLKREESAVELWDVLNRRRTIAFKADAEIWNLASSNPFIFSGNRTLAACGDAHGKVWAWNLDSGESIGPFPGHARLVRALRFSRDNRFLASGSMDNTVILWDLERRREIAQLRGSGGWIRSMDFSADGRVLAAVGNDGAIRLWSLSSFRELLTLPARTGPQSTLIFTADDRALLCWDHEGHRLQAFRALPLPQIEAEIAAAASF